MQEDYSLKKFRNTTQEDLPPEEKEKLDQYNAFMERAIQYTKDTEVRLQRREIGSARFAALAILDVLRPSNIGYFIAPQFTGRGGYKEHWKLQEKYGGTKRGQLLLAQEEAEEYNERYDTLAKEVQDRARAYEAAVDTFRNFVEEQASGEDRIAAEP